MDNSQLLAVAILLGALVLFASGRLRHDVIALATLGAVALAALAPADRIFAGFGHPAVLTVMAVLMISQALNRAGVVDMIAQPLAPYPAHQLQHMLLLTGVVAALSAFMNNVGALALMMPVALATAAEHGRNPSILLMPLAFASILGGMTTLIGTPPNIIIANLRADMAGTAGEPFGLFDFAPVGLPVAVLGVLFVALIGWRLLPKERQSADAQRAIFNVGEYLAELRVTEESPIVGGSLRAADLLFEDGTRVFGLIRSAPDGEPQRLPAVGFRLLGKGDVLIIQATPEHLAKLIETYKLEVVSERSERAIAVDQELEWKDASLLEVVVSPSSTLVGRNARVVDRIFGRNVSLLALARQGAPIRGRLREQAFEAGDVALLQGEADALRALPERFGLWPLAERGLQLGGGDRPLLALAVFAVAIALGMVGVVSLGVAFILAVVVYLLLGILPLRERYDGVDWSVIVLLGAMFPLGIALESTGVTSLIATSVVSGSDAAGLPAWAVLTLVLVVTMFLSDIINNAATALLMAPLAVQIAGALEASADAFLMAVAVGASCAFLTPIGHQCNTLVMGPGGYKFGDYWRMGLPLEVVIVAVSVPMILIAWPL
ncbi:MAG: SLC13 family permease [Neomegalonema sp.]